MAEWKTGVFDCFSDMGSCVMAYFCPCIQYGKNVEALGEAPCGSAGCFPNCCVFACCQGVVSCLLLAKHRQQVRKKYGIKDEGMMMDILCSWCCGCCIIAQISREMKAH